MRRAEGFHNYYRHVTTCMATSFLHLPGDSYVRARRPRGQGRTWNAGHTAGVADAALPGQIVGRAALLRVPAAPVVILFRLVLCTLLGGYTLVVVQV